LSAALGRLQVVAPGVAHADTIRAFHSAKFMEHACAQNCVLDVR
jgi:nickel-dependent lactate racemase